MNQRLTTLAAQLEAAHQALQQQITDLEAQRDELIRQNILDLPEAVAREIYQRGYRSGYSAGRRVPTTRGPYRKTRQILAGDTASDRLTLEGR